MNQEAFIISVLVSMFRMSPALLLPTIGEAFSERSGVYNVGLEGYMLVGALSSYYAVFFTGNLWVGVIMGIIGGMALSLLHAYFSITQKANQILCGVALWVFAMGFTGFLFRAVGITNVIKYFHPVQIPVWSKLPGVGPVIFHQNVIVYGTFLLIFISMYVLYRTPFGLILRAVGDNPLAVDIAGHNVFLIRYISVLICGGLAGLGGAYISLVILNRFVENAIAGRGFVALALVIFGRWNPLWILIGTLIFTFVDALQLNIQAAGVIRIPYPFLLMLPYLLAIIILVFFGRRVREPAKLAVPYTKGEE